MPAFFKVQGLLGPPPNLTLTILDEVVNVLTWDEPYCSTLLISPTSNLILVIIKFVPTSALHVRAPTGREFMFVNVGVNIILLTVTAVNVVGEGNRSTIIIMHWACDSNKDKYKNN